MIAFHFRKNPFKEKKFSTGGETRQYQSIFNAKKDIIPNCLNSSFNDLASQMMISKSNKNNILDHFISDKVNCLSLDLKREITYFKKNLITSHKDAILILNKLKIAFEKLKFNIFEDMRCLINSNLPSRKFAMYCAPISINKKNFRSNLKFNEEYSYCYKVELIGGKIHCANFNLLDCASQSISVIKNNAIKYWSHNSLYVDFTEILFEGTVNYIEHSPQCSIA